MVAEFESDLIRLRAKEAMRVAKAKGRLRGRQPKLNPRQEAHLVRSEGGWRVRALLNLDGETGLISSPARRRCICGRSSMR